jgi:hypothetical protein
MLFLAKGNQPKFCGSLNDSYFLFAQCQVAKNILKKIYVNEGYF